MPHPANQSCENCLYYVHHADEDDHGDPAFGACHRNSPPVLVEAGGVLSADMWAWPTVNAKEWCGDYSPGPVDNQTPPPPLQTKEPSVQ